jgi:hypothetical protein
LLLNNLAAIWADCSIVLKGCKDFSGQRFKLVSSTFT